MFERPSLDVRCGWVSQEKKKGCNRSEWEERSEDEVEGGD